MKKQIILAAAAISLLFVGCTGTPAKPTDNSKDENTVQTQDSDNVVPEDVITFGKLTADEAYSRLNSGDTVILLDVRTAEEYAEKHIPGAILLPNEDIGSNRPEVLPQLDAEILVYCRSGNRSAQAAKKLAKMGYTQVYDFGGINSWPYETVSGAYTQSEKDTDTASYSITNEREQTAQVTA